MEKLELGPETWRLETDGDGRVHLPLPLPEGWADYAYLVVTARVEAEGCPRLALRLDTGERGTLTQEYQVLPRCRVRIPFPIGPDALRAESAFLPAYPGLLKGSVRGNPIAREAVRVATLTIYGAAQEGIHIEDISLENARPQDTVTGVPMVDEMGQNKARDWSGKTASTQALTAYLRGERARGGTYPEGWSRWGGWLQKRFDATGWFHTVRDGRRWWLVDPDGYAFFSNGMCYGSRTGIYGLVDHLEGLHDWLPPPDGEYRDAWTTGDQIPQYVVRNGLEAAKERRLFNFARANMIRAFGGDWRDAWADLQGARLRRWGFNTLGVGVNEYGDEHTAAMLARMGIPYVWTFRFFPLTKTRIFRDFPDVFSDEYTEACRAFAARELRPLRHDPLLIGYFVTNEPEWFFAEVNLAERMMTHPEPLESRRVFAARMREKYGVIDALNQAWNTDFDSFEALLLPQAAGLDTRTPRAAGDFAAFHAEMVDAYGTIVSRALRAEDPHHLNLGMRYSSATKLPLPQKPAYFDVFSFNRYGAEPRGVADVVAARFDMPLVVGEWHIGAKDSGLNAWGLYHTDTQAQRAQAIGYYMEQATQSPNLVGIHYFEYSDQPLLGRFDGECYNIGLIDVCGRPYEEVARAGEEFARRIYPLLDGQEAPTLDAVPLQPLA